MANTEVTTQEQKRPHPLVVLRQQVEDRGQEFANALPAHIPVERFKRVILTAVQNNADLVAADRQSLFNSCMRAAQDGLLPDGRDGAIVIFNTKVNGEWVKKAQWMPMVFGILKKIRNSGELAAITARVVYGGDKFRYWIDDSGEHVEYEPADTPDTSIVRRVFAMAKTKGGEVYVEPMSVEEIEKVRQVSRSKDKGPWVDWWDQMAIKTALRRLAKRLPMSSDLDDLLRRDDDLYDLSGAGDAVQKRSRPSLTSALDQLSLPSSQEPEQKVLTVETKPADGLPRGHSAEMSEADKVVTESGKVLKDKNAGQAAPDDDFPGDHPNDAPAETKKDRGEEEALEERRITILEKIDHTPRGIDSDDARQVIAYVAGCQAADRGMAKKAKPREFTETGREAEGKAWEQGYDYAADHPQDGQ